MKIIHYVDRFSTKSQTFIYDVINRLQQKNDIENFVLTHKRVLREERHFPNVFVVPNPGVTPVRKILRKIRRRKFEFPIPDKVNAHIRVMNPDVIHAHFGHNGVRMNSLINDYSLDIPLLISFHGSDVLWRPSRDPAYLRDLLRINRTEKLLCTVNSEYLKAKLHKLGIAPEKIRVLYNRINSRFLETDRPIAKDITDRLKIINVGRYIRWKGQEYLIRGFSRFKKIYCQNATLTLVGFGDELNRLKNLCNEYNLVDSVTFMVDVSHEEIPDLLAQHDIYVQSSIRDPETNQEEAFGVAVLEAICVGLPVIVTNTGGLPEVVGEGHEFARIVPEKDPGAICDALKSMWVNRTPERSNGSYAQQRIEALGVFKFDENLLKIYSELCQ